MFEIVKEEKVQKTLNWPFEGMCLKFQPIVIERLYSSIQSTIIFDLLC